MSDFRRWWLEEFNYIYFDLYRIMGVVGMNGESVGWCDVDGGSWLAVFFVLSIVLGIWCLFFIYFFYRFYNSF